MILDLISTPSEFGALAFRRSLCSLGSLVNANHVSSFSKLGLGYK